MIGDLHFTVFVVKNEASRNASALGLVHTRKRKGLNESGKEQKAVTSSSLLIEMAGSREMEKTVIDDIIEKCRQIICCVKDQGPIFVATHSCSMICNFLMTSTYPLHDVYIARCLWATLCNNLRYMNSRYRLERQSIYMQMLFARN